MIEVNGVKLNTDAFSILKDLRLTLNNGKLNVLELHNEQIKMTCPFHKEGHESSPSCGMRNDNGVFHCFTCNQKGGIDKFVAATADISFAKAQEWLINNYGEKYDTSESIVLTDISLVKNYTNRVLLDSYLNRFTKDYVPYFESRNISKEVFDKFELCYDPVGDLVVFPVRDENNKLVGVTKRKVAFKRYELPKFDNKPVYLLNQAIKDKRRGVIVTEGQIDALVSYSYGAPAVALFGAGTTSYQLNLLRSSGLTYYILMYDNDEAGRQGAEKFKQYMGDKSIIVDIVMPKGLDVGGCTKEQFIEILRQNDCDFILE